MLHMWQLLNHLELAELLQQAVRQAELLRQGSALWGHAILGYDYQVSCLHDCQILPGAHVASQGNHPAALVQPLDTRPHLCNDPLQQRLLI